MSSGKSAGVHPGWISSVAAYRQEPYRQEKSALVAIGNFDGVHIGHQAVLRDAVSLAAQAGLVPVVLTFDPHPADVLGKGEHLRLTDTARKVELLRALAPELCVVVEPFTRELAAMEPSEFVEQLLVDALRAKCVLVGQNFRFGRQRAGDLALLSGLGEGHGFEARASALAAFDGEPVSSSRIRSALRRGEDVQALLGRPHSVSATVVAGAQRGRTLGFPTANLGEAPEMLPANGVYVCQVEALGEGAAPLGTGVVNVGVRPTVASAASGPTAEVHLLDFRGDLYGKTLRVHFGRRLREERRFPDVSALAEQIALDVLAARSA